MMDNKIFHVNGAGPSELAHALEMILMQDDIDHRRNAFGGWVEDRELGLILFQCRPANGYREGEYNRLLSKVSATDMAKMAWDWVSGLPEEDYPILHDDEADLEDFDVDVRVGWSVSRGDVWGHIGKWRDALCVIRPCFLWLSK